MKKVLLTGGAGYIGSVLARELLKRGYFVKILDNKLYKDKGIKDLYKEKKFEFVQGDIRHIEDVVKVVEDIDAIIHLAAIVGDPSSKLKPKETIEINYFATKLLGDVAKYFGIQRFIFASTCSVYGYTEEYAREDSPTNPLSLYAKTKLMAEKALLEIADKNFQPTILRLATVYGYSPRMRFDLVVNLFIAKAIFDKEITVFGKGVQRRPFIHVKDLSEAIIKILEAPLEKVGCQVFNVGSNNQNYTIEEIALKIKEVFPDIKVKYIEEKEDERSYFVDFSKIEKTIKFRPKYDIKYAAMEIKEAIEKGKIKDYRNKEYYNYKMLLEH